MEPGTQSASQAITLSLLDARGQVLEQRVVSSGGKSAARQARAWATKARPVLAEGYPEGGRLYRREWAGCGRGGFAYRLECPGCVSYTRWPGSEYCRACENARRTERKRAGTAAANKEKGVARSFGLR